MPKNSAPAWESEDPSGERISTWIQVSVQGYLTFKALVGKRQIALSAGSSLLDLLAQLREELDQEFKDEAFNANGELVEHVAILVNGMHYRHLSQGIQTILEDGDQVAIFPPLVGG